MEKVASPICQKHTLQNKQFGVHNLVLTRGSQITRSHTYCIVLFTRGQNKPEGAVMLMASQVIALPGALFS